MKKIIGQMKISIQLTVIVVILCLNTNITAQTKEDSLAIKNICMDYIEGYFTKDAKRMESSLHPELVKRTIKQDEDGKSYIISLSKSYMGFVTKHNSNTDILNPTQDIKAKVEIFDIFNNVCSVKITNNQYRFIDYLHIGKFDGQWKIINVLWENY